MGRKNFLSANWNYLAMFNYEVDPKILERHIPPGTEIDFFDGKALVSIVGFLFNNTRVLGVKWPWHINFEEANLRYYVKRLDGNQWKRGVGFISEIVPLPAVSLMANLLYNEHYSTAKMNHQLLITNERLNIEYTWQKRDQRNNVIRISAAAETIPIAIDSEEEFIFEHYFGYNKLSDSTIIEYGVNHPRWEVYPVIDYSIDCDIENLYGEEFVPFILHQKPHSVFLAKGSEVTVQKPVKYKV